MEDIDRTFEKLKRPTFDEMVNIVHADGRLVTTTQMREILNKNHWTYHEYHKEFMRRM